MTNSSTVPRSVKRAANCTHKLEGSNPSFPPEKTPLDVLTSKGDSLANHRTCNPTRLVQIQSLLPKQHITSGFLDSFCRNEPRRLTWLITRRRKSTLGSTPIPATMRVRKQCSQANSSFGRAIVYPTISSWFESSFAKHPSTAPRPSNFLL